MLMLVTFALLATSALSAPAAPADGMGLMMTSAAPSMNKMLCCPPKRWSAMMYDLKAATGLQYATEYAQDAEMMMEGTVTVNTADGTIISQIFTDYANMKMYSVDTHGASANKCVVSTPTHGFYSDCYSNTTSLITNVNYVGDATLGGGAVKFDVFTFDVYTDLKITMALTQDKCIPILENVVSTKDHVDSLLFYNDVKTTVEPRLLQMPAACVGASSGGVVG